MSYEDKMYSTAMNILDRREDQLMHYGRKGMKWGEDIYAQDESSANRPTITAPRKDDIRAQGQAIREEQRKRRETEALRAQGQAVREAQRQERAAQNKYSPDPRANQAAQAFNRAKFDYMNKWEKGETGGNTGNPADYAPDGSKSLNQQKQDLLLKAKKEKLIREAKNGQTNGGDIPSQRPNTPTTFDMERNAAKKDYLNTKKDILLAKARGEQHNNESKPVDEPKYNGKTTREHITDLKNELDNAFDKDFVGNTFANARAVGEANGTKMTDEDIQGFKDDMRIELGKEFNKYLQENNIPESEAPKFQAFYDSVVGNYDDAIDQVWKKGAYAPVFGNKKSNY